MRTRSVARPFFSRAVVRAAALLVALGCGDSRTPEEVALDFAARLGRGEAARAEALLSAEERAAARSVPEGAILGHDFAIFARLPDPEDRDPGWRLGTSSMPEPGRALVLLSTPGSNGREGPTWPLVLENENGAWRVRLRESERVSDPERDDADALALFRRLDGQRRNCMLWLR